MPNTFRTVKLEINMTMAWPSCSQQRIHEEHSLIVYILYGHSVSSRKGRTYILQMSRTLWAKGFFALSNSIYLCLQQQPQQYTHISLDNSLPRQLFLSVVLFLSVLKMFNFPSALANFPTFALPWLISYFPSALAKFPTFSLPWLISLLSLCPG